jgi:hypothetical protein
MIPGDPLVASTIGAKLLAKRQVDINADLAILIQVCLPNRIFPGLRVNSFEIPIWYSRIAGITW